MRQNSSREGGTGLHTNWSSTSCSTRNPCATKAGNSSGVGEADVFPNCQSCDITTLSWPSGSWFTSSHMLSVSCQYRGVASSLSEDEESCIEDLTFVHVAATPGQHLWQDAPHR